MIDPSNQQSFVIRPISQNEASSQAGNLVQQKVDMNSSLIKTFRLQVMEVPDYITVETRLLTHDAAKNVRPSETHTMDVNSFLSAPLSRYFHAVLNEKPNPSRLPKTTLNAPVHTALPANTTMRQINALPKAASNYLSHALPKTITLATSSITQTTTATPLVKHAPKAMSNLSIAKTYSLNTTVTAPKTTTTTTTQSNTLPMTNTTMVTTSALPIATAKVVVEASTLTDSPNPTRNRGQQCEEVVTHAATIAIQCQMDEEEEEKYFENAENQNSVSIWERKRKFLNYVKNNTQRYGNGKWECSVCGEIKAKATTIHAHMAQHYGPSVLCWRCGINFENKTLLKSHACEAKRKTNAFRVLSCPHYHCRVKAVSPLELFDHINEHCAIRCHRCVGCLRSFSTAGEMRRHRSMRFPCLEKAKQQRLPYRRWKTKREACYRVRAFYIHPFAAKRVIVKAFLSMRNKSSRQTAPQQCQICCKICTNKFMFDRHLYRCLRTFRHRYDRKRSGERKIQQNETLKVSQYFRAPTL